MRYPLLASNPALGVIGPRPSQSPDASCDPKMFFLKRAAIAPRPNRNYTPLRLFETKGTVARK